MSTEPSAFFRKSLSSEPSVRRIEFRKKLEVLRLYTVIDQNSRTGTFAGTRSRQVLAPSNGLPLWS
jgi:hypothetical protein